MVRERSVMVGVVGVGLALLFEGCSSQAPPDESQSQDATTELRLASAYGGTVHTDAGLDATLDASADADSSACREVDLVATKEADGQATLSTPMTFTIPSSATDEQGNTSEVIFTFSNSTADSSSVSCTYHRSGTSYALTGCSNGADAGASETADTFDLHFTNANDSSTNPDDKHRVELTLLETAPCAVKDSGVDAPRDVSSDLRPDVSADSGADVASDVRADAPGDAAGDSSDAGVDAPPDVVIDAPVDVVADVPTCSASNCTPNNSCDVATCSGSTCTHTAATNGTSCTGTNLCNQTYTCQSGICTGSSPVVCTASDSCHVAGTCAPSTGLCSNPTAPNGTTCTGTNLCEQTYACSSGVCTGSNPVLCTAADQCHLPGTCNPSTGVCSNPTEPDGTACSTGNLCFAGGACTSGTCTGTSPVTCTASDQCHVAGTCSPTTGVCSNPTEPDGTACTGTNLCDKTYACASGACTGSSPVVCTPLDACHSAGTCSPTSGVCSNPTNGLCGDGGTSFGEGGTLNGTVATNLASTAAPLFLTADGGTGAINPSHVAVIRGRVFALPSGTPFAGVTVSTLGHPEYRTATTGADGYFNLAVNGGGQVTIVYTAPAGPPTYLRVQRHTQTQWQQFAIIPDVYLTPLDPTVTSIAMSNPTWQAAQGSTITDSADMNGVDGGPPVSPTLPHTARVFFPAGTTTSFTYGACSGTTEGTCSSGTSGSCAQGTCVAGICTGTAPSSITVRATEYTSGSTGHAAMPAELPANTGYTYAVSLSADETSAMGATGLSLSQPVSFYVEDFLGFGPAQPGTANPAVPVGFYDETAGQWVPIPNGNIVEITGFSGPCPGIGCTAIVNEPASADAGVVVTLSADELAFLGQTYQGRATPLFLWRFTTSHFSGFDANFPFGPPPGAGGPPGSGGEDGGADGGGGGGGGPGPGSPQPDPKPDCQQGSIIECQNQILAQQMAIPGTPYVLRYQSERAPGRPNSTIQIPLTGSTIPVTTPPFLRAEVTIAIAGQFVTLTYPAASLTPNETITWTWNRQDAFGNTVEGLQQAAVTVSYVYQAQYNPGFFAPSGDPAFGQFSPSGPPLNILPIRALNQISLGNTTTLRLGVQDAAPSGLGGWTISPQHVYDPGSQTLWQGDGKRRIIEPSMSVIRTLPGPITPGTFNIIPTVAPDGTVYEVLDNTLNKVDSSGALTLLAAGEFNGGTGTNPGPFGPCTPLSSVSFTNGIDGLAVSSGGLVYEASPAMINVIDPVAGTIQTIAGTGAPGCTDNPIGTKGTVGTLIYGLAVAPDGSAYFVDRGCATLRRIGADGSLQTITARQPCTVSAAYTVGQHASTACFDQPFGVAVAADGTIFGSDAGLVTQVYRIDGRSGVITTYAGGAITPILPPPAYDGRLATTIRFGAITGLAVGGDGMVYASDSGDGLGIGAVYGIDITGIAHLVAGGAPSSVTVEMDNGPAVGSLVRPAQLAVHPNGSLLLHDNGATGIPARVRFVQTAFPIYSPNGGAIPSEDGSEVYTFNNFGQHLSTLDPVTGATLRTFQYNAANQLTGIVEARGGTTTLSYGGTKVTVTPPFSVGTQQTTVTLDAVGGRAVSIQTPAGETTSFTYTNGLMTSLTDPKLNVHKFSFDTAGRLLQDEDPTSASTVLSTTIRTAPLPAAGGAEPLLSWSTAVTAPDGEVTIRNDYTLSNGSRERIRIAPSGATRTSIQTSSDLWTSTSPDGTVTSKQYAPDPQYGMLDPYVGTLTRTTPSGTSYSLTRTRTSTGSALAPGQILDRSTINGQASSWASTFTAATGSLPGQWSYVTPAGRQRLQQLDSLGRVTSVVFPGTTTLPTATYAYDGDGRVVSVSVVANGTASTRMTTMTYDSYLAGYLATLTDAIGNVTTYDKRDNDGRILDVELPDFSTTPQSHVAMSFDAKGNLASMQVPPATSLSSVHTFTDTPVDLLASYTPPQVSSLGGGLATLSTSYAYDGDRQLTSSQSPEGAGYQQVTQAYDTYGRLLSKVDGLAAVTTTYQYVTNLSGVFTDQVAAVVTSDGVTVANSFDGFLKNQVQWASGSVSGAVNWTYDRFFRPATMQVGSTAIAYAYDADSLYVGTSSPAFTITRDVKGSSLDGLVYAATLGNVGEAWTYDGFGAVASYTVTSGGTVVYAMSGTSGTGTPITRDALGRITAMQEAVNGTTHTWSNAYDSRGRLASVIRDGLTTSYGYDANGNMTSVDGTAFGAFDAQDRMLSFTPPGDSTWSLTYTNNGDLSTKSSGSGEVLTFAYDLSTNLRSVSAVVSGLPSWSTSYLIDGMSRRIGKVVTGGSVSVQQGLLYDEQRRVVAELDGSNNVISTFVYGLKPNVPDYMVRGGTAFRLVSDWRGDVRLVLDTTKTGGAAVVQQIDYDEWGNVTNLVDPSCTLGGTALCFQPFGFAGGLFEPASQVLRFGARDYDPLARRWTAKDPLGLWSGTNAYAYVSDDPINSVDPSGECIPCIVVGIGVVLSLVLPSDTQLTPPPPAPPPPSPPPGGPPPPPRTPYRDPANPAPQYPQCGGKNIDDTSECCRRATNDWSDHGDECPPAGTPEADRRKNYQDCMDENQWGLGPPGTPPN